MSSSPLSFPAATRPAVLRPALPARRPAASRTRCGAASGREQYGGALVDSGMAVLRRRIREARMAETNYEAPAGWAGWEKRYYPAYVSDVSALAGALQLLAMGTRPTVAAAVVAVLLAGVPVSAAVLLHHLGLAAVAALHHVS